MLNIVKSKWRSLKLTMKLGPAAGHGNWEQVIQIQKELDAISGEPESSYYTYADAYFHLYDLKKAEYFANKALEVDEDDFKALKILTEIYFKQNMHGKAKEYAIRALANPPKLSSDQTDSFLILILKLFSFIPKIRKGRMSIEGAITNIEIRGNKWLLWADNYVNTQNEESINIVANDKQIENWSRRLPDLDNEWTHWWLEGEDYCLGVVSLENLSKATNIIVENWQRFSSIYAYRARMDENGDPIKQSGRTEISNYKNELKELEPQ